LPLLGQRSAPGWDEIFASHEFHEINQYYPMRAIRTRTRSYIENLAWQLPYPVAGDVAGSESWKAIASDSRIRIGRRTQAAYLQRPAREFYDLTRDRDEVVNLAEQADRRVEREALASRLTAWRAATRDPWLEGQTSPHQPEQH
jgi:N-sulfoglucosamine sulfohydrolase